MGGVGRAGLALARLLAALEVFRLGYLVGSYRQGADCTLRLVALRSPLGGELAAIIRGKVGFACRAGSGLLAHAAGGNSTCRHEQGVAAPV